MGPVATWLSNRWGAVMPASRWRVAVGFWLDILLAAALFIYLVLKQAVGGLSSQVTGGGAELAAFYRWWAGALVMATAVKWWVGVYRDQGKDDVAAVQRHVRGLEGLVRYVEAVVDSLTKLASQLDGKGLHGQSQVVTTEVLAAKSVRKECVNVLNAARKIELQVCKQHRDVPVVVAGLLYDE